MPAKLLYRVEEGPVTRDGVVAVARGQWAVLALTRVPDPEDTTTPFDPGRVVAVCATEQEAERVAREYLFGPAGDPVPPDALDALPEGEPDDPDAKWPLAQLDDEDDTEVDDDE